MFEVEGRGRHARDFARRALATIAGCSFDHGLRDDVDGLPVLTVKNVGGPTGLLHECRELFLHRADGIGNVVLFAFNLEFQAGELKLDFQF